MNENDGREMFVDSNPAAITKWDRSSILSCFGEVKMDVRNCGPLQHFKRSNTNPGNAATATGDSGNC